MKKGGDGFFSDDPVWRADYRQNKGNAFLDKYPATTQKEDEDIKAFAEQVATYAQQRGGVKVSPGVQMSMRVP